MEKGITDRVRVRSGEVSKAFSLVCALGRAGFELKERLYQLPEVEYRQVIRLMGFVNDIIRDNDPAKEAKEKVALAPLMNKCVRCGAQFDKVRSGCPVCHYSFVS